MNAARRKEIEELRTKAEDLSTDIEAIQSDEKEYYDNMSDSLREGEKGNASASVIDALQSAIGSLTEVAGSLDEAAQ